MLSIPALSIAALRHFVFILACVLPVAMAHATEGGKFQFVTGDVKIVSSDGKERVAKKGDSFNTGDTILTGASGTAQIRMNDGGLMAIRADTQVKLDQYVFNGREDGNERSLLSLIKGGFRTITGLIGNRNKDNYRIVTPSATIGIRGTDHEPVVIPPGAPGGFQAGTYDRVYRGATIITTEKGKLIVNPNQVGFAPGKGVAPIILPKLPEFYDVKPPQPSAAKDPDKGQQQSSSGDNSTTTTKSSDAVKSLSTTSTLRAVGTDADTSTATTLKTDAVRSTISTDTLTTPLTDTTKATTTTLDSSALTTPTTTLKSTTSSTLSTTPITTTTTTTAPTTTLSAPTTTLSAPTTTLSAPTTAITAPATTTISPITTTVSPVTSTLTAPVTSTVVAPTTTTLTAPTTTLQKSLITK